jgi:hypothetical protein
MCDTQKKIVFNIVLYFISFLIFMTVDMHLKDIKIGNKFQKTQLDHDCVMHVFN